MIKENQTLKELKLSMLPINGPLSSMIVDSLNSMILTSNCLIHLEVSHCGMQEEEIRIIVETMKRSKTLTCKIYYYYYSNNQFIFRCSSKWKFNK